MRFLVSVLVLSACSSMPVTPAAPNHNTYAALAAKRAMQLDRLHDYWVAGEMPLGDAGNPISVFRDAAGRECPMASLISQDGGEAIVAEVVAKANALRIADVKEGPLVDWILDSGLTRDEVVLVQGVMELDYVNLELRFPERDVQMAAAQHQIRKRVREIEAQLRAATPKSLEIAVAAAKAPRVASQAPVVPKHLEQSPVATVRRLSFPVRAPNGN